MKIEGVCEVVHHTPHYDGAIYAVTPSVRPFRRDVSSHHALFPRRLNQHLAPSRLQRFELMHPKQRLIIAHREQRSCAKRKISGIRSAQAEKPQEAGASRSSRGIVAGTAFRAGSARF